MVRRQQSFWNFNTESCNYSNFAVRYVYLQTCYQMTHPWAKLICTIFCNNREKCDESISINTWNCKSRVWFHWPQLDTTTKLNSCFVTLTGDTCCTIRNIKFQKSCPHKKIESMIFHPILSMRKVRWRRVIRCDQKIEDLENLETLSSGKLKKAFKYPRLKGILCDSIRTSRVQKLFPNSEIHSS